MNIIVLVPGDISIHTVRSAAELNYDKTKLSFRKKEGWVNGRDIKDETIRCILEDNLKDDLETMVLKPTIFWASKEVTDFTEFKLDKDGNLVKDYKKNEILTSDK